MTIDAGNEKITKLPSLPDWESIDTVLLDMDGTLLDLHFDNHFWLQHVPLQYAEKYDLHHDDAHQQLMDKYTRVRGTLDWYCVDFWTRELSLDITQLKHDIAEKISIRPEVVDFLNWLNQRDKRVVLVTNAHPASLDLKMERTGLHIHFDNIINSHDLGMPKEHDGFWEKLHDYEQYNQERTMLIDDNLEVLECARHYGIRYCYGIVLPDSHGKPIESKEFTTLHGFREIMS